MARQTAVKAKYGLWMTQAEHDAIARILATCPNEQIPTSTIRPVVVTTTSSTTSTSTPVVKTTTTAPKPATTTTTTKTITYPTFANCTAMHLKYPHGVAKSGGVDMVSGKPRSPQPAYYVSTGLYNANSGMDRDKDGVACEAP